MDKVEIFQHIISSLAHATNFERFLSQTFTADGRDWTAGQFLYKHFFDQIPAFNAAAAQGDIAPEDQSLADKLKTLHDKNLINPLKVYPLMEAGQLPDTNMFDGNRAKETFYRNLFCNVQRSAPGNPCYWPPASQYYTRFVEHRLLQMGMSENQVMTLMVHCEREREKAEAVAKQTMPDQFVHNTRLAPDQMTGNRIQARPRTDDHFLNLQKYNFFAPPDTFHAGLPIQGQVPSLSWPRFSPKLFAFQMTPNQALTAFQDSYNYQIDMNQRDSFRPIIPLWGGRPNEWVSTRDLTYNSHVEKETVGDLMAKGISLYLVPNLQVWEQLMAGQDTLSEAEAQKYMAHLATKYPDKVIKLGPDFLNRYQEKHPTSSVRKRLSPDMFQHIPSTQR